MNGFDWAALMAAGLRGLRLPPAVFWRLSPAELAFLMGRGSGAAPLTRDGLEALARAYPDKLRGERDE
ncbi:MAG: rcc01693 family protein [Pseudomonadota bacterium]